MSLTSCYAALSAKAPLTPFKIERPKMGANDVQISIDFCGVCHTDLHYINNDWGGSHYPLVPGHEIIGKVTALGKDVKHLKIGQRVAAGYIGGSCQACSSCRVGLEQYCLNGLSTIFNSPTKDPGGFSYGGYSKSIVLNQYYVLIIPVGLDPASAAPLLCAGITTYSPLKHWGVKPGMTVGVIGLGFKDHSLILLCHKRFIS
jgi:uncharacterized zinc-type alcohol dehydrogenase-like protein